MGEFDALTIEERKALAAAWTAAARPHGLYVIVNVGTTVLAEAVELAQHAVSVGADAIAAVSAPLLHSESPHPHNIFS